MPAWPAQQRQRWEDALRAMRAACGEGFEDENPLLRYADPSALPVFSRNDGTRRNHAHAWGRWLYVMKRAGADWQIEPPRIEKFIRSCLADGCSHGGIASYLSSLLFMIPIVAPKTDKAIVKILRDTRDAEKRRHGQPKVTEIVHPSKLVRAGLELMERAEGPPVSSRSAVEYADGLLMVVGTVLPARGINVGRLRLGHDLFLDDEPRITWEAVDIKGRKAHSYDLPEELAQPMRTYRDKYRPMMMGADAERQNWFWGRRRGGSGENRELTTMAINRIVSKRSLEFPEIFEGKRVTGHSRRHGVATMFAEEAPENVDMVTTLLQQADPRSREFYSRKARKVTASKRSAEVLAEIRKSM